MALCHTELFYFLRLKGYLKKLENLKRILISINF